MLRGLLLIKCHQIDLACIYTQDLILAYIAVHNKTNHMAQLWTCKSIPEPNGTDYPKMHMKNDSTIEIHLFLCLRLFFSWFWIPSSSAVFLQGTPSSLLI